VRLKKNSINNVPQQQQPSLFAPNKLRSMIANKQHSRAFSQSLPHS